MSDNIKNILTITLPIITLIIGSLLGFIIGIIKLTIEQRNKLIEKLIDQFFSARDSIINKLSDLSNLKINKNIEHSKINEYANEISKLFYKNFDIMPIEILYELNCLHACINDKNNRMFKIENGELYPIENSEMNKFINEISIVKNANMFGLMSLNSNNPSVKKATSINFQARKVLRSLNKYFTLKYLNNIIKHIGNKN